MTGTKQDFMKLAGRSPRCAAVLADPARTRFALLDLASVHTAVEAKAACDLGLTVHAGIVAVSKFGNLDFCALPGFEWIVLQALTEFGNALCKEAEQQEVQVLESWAKLPDERTLN